MSHLNNAQEDLANTALKWSNLIIVTGIQWWDEGKGKAVSSFQWQKIRYIVWPNGWGNAGHTAIYKWKKLDFHELPGGSIIEGATIYLAKGKVIQLSTLGTEMQKLSDNNISLQWKIIIGGWAQVVFKWFQQAIDKHIEALRWSTAVGTTLKWIGPAYSAEALRIGLTTKELVMMNKEQLTDRVQLIVWLYPFLDKDTLLSEVFEEQKKLKDWIKQWIVQIDFDDMLINTAYKNWDTILAEQSQSFLLGKEWGAYPNCTSSDTSINGLLSYMNLPYNSEPIVVGAMKAIMSKVWGGLLATQMGRDPTLYTFEREFARSTWEVGVTTGRLRQLWWVDLPALRYVQSINPLDILVVTKGDVLRILAQAQVKAWLDPEMRFYQNFRKPNSKDKPRTSWVTTDPMMVGTYTSIRLSSKSTPKNIARFGSKIRKCLEYDGPIYFGTGPGEEEIVRF